MNCPTELTCSLYVDGVLPDDAAAQIEQHVRNCSSCAARVAALAAESRMLKAALAIDDETVPVPPFERPLGTFGVLAFGAGGLLCAWLAGAVWRGVLGIVPAELDWLNPFNVGRLWDLFVAAVLFVFHEGTPMIGNIVTAVSIASLVLIAATVALTAHKRHAGAALAWSALLLAVGLPSTGHALDIRRGEALVNVGPNETIDDTLIVFSDSVTIDGTVDGDLIAFTRTLTVRGQVTGNIVGFAQSVDVDGPVGGTVYAFGQSIDVRDRIARNLFAFASTITIGNEASVDRNATLFAGTGAVRGRIGQDLTAFTADLEISGTIERNVNARGERVRVVEPARIGGELRAASSAEDNIQVAPGATVAGRTDIEIDEELEERSTYATPGFYVRQVIRVAAAFVIGLLVLWLLPGLRNVRVDSAGTALLAGGVGLAGIILLPILSILALVTIIGIPLGVAGIFVWLLALYFAKILVAFMVGRRLFETQSGALPHYAALLIAGLVIVTIAVNLPFIGGLLNAVLTLVGFGLLVLHFAGYARGGSFTAASM